MTKIAEKMHLDEMTGQLVVQETHNFQPVIEKAKSLQSAGVENLGSDNKLVGLVPMKMWAMWAKKWGVDVTDHDAMKEVVKRELMDSNNSQLRVWEGSY